MHLRGVATPMISANIPYHHHHHHIYIYIYSESRLHRHGCVRSKNVDIYIYL